MEKNIGKLQNITWCYKHCIDIQQFCVISVKFKNWIFSNLSYLALGCIRVMKVLSILGFQFKKK